MNLEVRFFRRGLTGPFRFDNPFQRRLHRLYDGVVHNKYAESVIDP